MLLVILFISVFSDILLSLGFPSHLVELKLVIVGQNIPFEVQSPAQKENINLNNNSL